MNTIDYVIGNENIVDAPLIAFDNDVIDFLQKLSVSLMSDENIRKYSDIAAFAYFCRKSNIKKERQKQENEFRLGRGLCFHIAPSNIPLNFAFSYVMALVAGNANIVRMPSKNFPQAEIVISKIKDLLENYPKLLQRTAFVKYDKNSDWTQHFSLIADCRMIWGGDTTISSLKKQETKASCVDVTFPDRYSVAIIDGNSILESDSKALSKLAADFYNDTYLMDQNACSSPKLILWLNDNKDARKLFWGKEVELAKIKYLLQPYVSVDKFTKLCIESIKNKNLSSINYTENYCYRAEISTLSEDLFADHSFGGWFFEYSLEDITDFVKITTPKIQTVTYYGIDPNLIHRALQDFPTKGIDRVVPIGKALDIGFDWDGIKIINNLSRYIKINVIGKK